MKSGRKRDPELVLLFSQGKKKCSLCRNVFDLSEFYADRTQWSGRSSWCKPCSLLKPSAQKRKYNPAEAGATLARGHKTCSRCGQELSLDNFNHNAYNTDGFNVYCIPCRKEKRAEELPKIRAYRNKIRYGISEWEYIGRYLEQKGKCDICGTWKDINGKWSARLVIEHCHKTMKIRGLVCNSCNTLLGACKDNPEILVSAIEYLNRNAKSKHRNGSTVGLQNAEELAN